MIKIMWTKDYARLLNLMEGLKSHVTKLRGQITVLEKPNAILENSLIQMEQRKNDYYDLYQEQLEETNKRIDEIDALRDELTKLKADNKKQLELSLGSMVVDILKKHGKETP